MFEGNNYRKYEYYGKNYRYPESPDICPICKKHIKMKKHGFYARYFITCGFIKKILVRRYICPDCGKTVSFLPHFCIPHFQYDIDLIIYYMKRAINKKGTLRACIDEIRNMYPDILICRQHILFYMKRFINNITFIQYGLRQIKPETDFCSAKKHDKERARELIEIISNGFESAHIFAKRFMDNCNRTFLASLDLF